MSKQVVMRCTIWEPRLGKSNDSVEKRKRVQVI